MQFDNTYRDHKKFRGLNKKEEKQLGKKLEYYTQFSDAQFKVHESAGLKPLKNKTLPPKIARRISLGIDKTIWEFRINDKIRVHGLLFESTFYIVWIDPDHKYTDKHK